MQTVTVSELKRNFGQVESWLNDGEDVKIFSHGKPLGRLVPDRQPRVRIDWAAQRREIWGDRPPFTAAQVKEMQDWEDGEP